MLELVALVCLVASPATCKDVSLNVAEMTPQQCMLGAQSEGAKWVGQHPDWRVAKYVCGRVGRYARA